MNIWAENTQPFRHDKKIAENLSHP